MQCEVTGFESKAYQAVSRMYASATLALSLRFQSIPLIVYGRNKCHALIGHIVPHKIGPWSKTSAADELITFYPIFQSLCVKVDFAG